MNNKVCVVKFVQRKNQTAKYVKEFNPWYFEMSPGK